MQVSKLKIARLSLLESNLKQQKFNEKFKMKKLQQSGIIRLIPSMQKKLKLEIEPSTQQCIF